MPHYDRRRNRSREELTREILAFCDNKEPRLLTRILGVVGINSKQGKEYIPKLLELDLLQTTKDPYGHEAYKTTTKGQNYVKQFDGIAIWHN